MELMLRWLFINGFSLDENIDKIKSEMGVVFQQSVLDDKLTVYENLYYRAMLYNLTETDFKQNLDFYVTHYIPLRYITASIP